jgi:hypothetical protein
LYVPDRAAAPAERDCTDCGKTNGMKLRNVVAAVPVHIRLPYVRMACGALLPIPPVKRPLLNIELRAS